MTARPTVRTLICCYNDWVPLGECLASLAKSAYRIERASVLDNGSDDPVPPAFGDGLPMPVDVQRIAPNRGYAGGMNCLVERALGDADADLLLLLNADARLEPDTLERLVKRLEDDPQLGGLSPRILDSGTGKPWFVGGRLQVAKARAAHLQEARTSGLDLEGEFVSGCVFLVRRAVLDRIRGFEERYFMYMEDVDMCLRIRRAGWRLGVDGDALAYHAVSKGRSRSAASSDLKQYFIARNRILFARLHLPALASRLYFAAFYLLDLVRDSWRDWRAGRRRDARLRLAGARDGVTGVTGAPAGEALLALQAIANDVAADAPAPGLADAQRDAEALEEFEAITASSAGRT